MYGCERGVMYRGRTLLVGWIKLLLLCGVFWPHADAATLLEIIQMKGNLREVYQQFTFASLTHLLKEDNITLFLPSNNAFLSFRPETYGFSSKLDNESFRKLMLYHIVNGKITTTHMYTQGTAMSKLGTKVYFNAYQSHKKVFDLESSPSPKSLGTLSRYRLIESSKETEHAANESLMYNVNGATVIEGDIQTDNGVLHVIDMVIAPVGSSKTLRRYHEAPDMKTLSFSSISKAATVLPEILARSDSQDAYFTAFSPNDSYLNSMPKYGQDRLFGNVSLLQNVFKAHIILGKVYFLPSNAELLPLLPLLGTLKFSRSNNKIYVSNNKVIAEVLLPNIPVANGVIHMVDNMLYYVYQNLIQKLQSMSQTRVVAGLFSRLPLSVRALLEDGDQTFTLFVPTDAALAKLPNQQQQRLRENVTVLAEILSNHIVTNTDGSANTFLVDRTFQTLGNTSLTLYRVRDDVYVEGGYVWAKLVQVDIGCTNGVIHLISNVLFYRNFSILETIEDTDYLSQIGSYIHRYPEIQDLFSSEANSPLTVFLPGDATMEAIPPRIKEKFSVNLTYMNQALKGQIVQGVELSSSHVKTSVDVGTLLGKHVVIWKTKEGYLYVKGGHISAKIVVSDIWCSNGVLHIIDNLLHVPTRNVMEEIKRIPSLSLAYSALAVANMKDFLSSESEKFTLFIPGDEAFWKIPHDKMSALMGGHRIKQVMSAHIANGTVRFKDSFRYGEVLRATRNQIYIIKQGDDFYVISSNVKARVIRSDITATNGVIHVIDEVLGFPYQTVAEMMSSQSALRPFYDILSLDPIFLSEARMERKQISVFAPSDGFLNTIGEKRLQRIKDNPVTIRKLFSGHVVQGMRVDGKYLRARLRHKCVITNEFNITFTIFRNRSGGIYIDAGYGIQRLYLINPAFGCSNGIIYIIDGFLNYSPFNLLEVIDKEPLVSLMSIHFEQLLFDMSHEFLDENRTFTLFVPGNTALEYMSTEQIATLLQTKPYKRSQLYHRHVINGSALAYQDLETRKLGLEMLKQGVTVDRDGKDTYLKWSGIRAKINRPNIPASNGIIHVVERLLYVTERDTFILLKPTTRGLATHRYGLKGKRTSISPLTSWRGSGRTTQRGPVGSPSGTTAHLTGPTRSPNSASVVRKTSFGLYAFSSLLITVSIQRNT